MIEVIKSGSFEKWLRKLKDRDARFRIAARIDRLEKAGGFGDTKPLGNGVSEMRIDYGPGYRIYYILSGSIVVVLLAGGDKRTQKADIKRAAKVASQWRQENE